MTTAAPDMPLPEPDWEACVSQAEDASEMCGLGVETMYGQYAIDVAKIAVRARDAQWQARLVAAVAAEREACAAACDLVWATTSGHAAAQCAAAIRARG